MINRLRVTLLAAVVALAGCDENKPPPPKADAKKESKSATDAKLEAAMAAASAAAAASGASKKNAAQDGPPEGGIFAPGAADKLMARGADPRIELASDGSEPRVALLSTAAAWKGTATITTGVRLGPRNALPSIELLAALGPEKSKDKKDKDADAGAPPAFLQLVGDVTKAQLAADQPGKLPEGLQKEIAKLKGSQLRWTASHLGLVREPSSVLVKDKDAPADLQRSLDAAAEALFYLSVPPPPKPVGAGASWIAGSRLVLGGVEVIAYRLYKVKSASPDGVQLTVESREYAVSDKLAMEGLPKGASMVQFESTAQGEMELSPKETLATKGKVVRQMTLGLKAEGGPQGGAQGGVMGIPFTTEATVSRK